MRWFVIYILLLHCTPVSAQPLKRLNHIAYNVDDGLLQSHVNEITEDGNGFIWISTGSGVQRLDGRNFWAVQQTNNSIGIPDDKNPSLFRLQNGNVLISNRSIVTEYDIHTNRFKQLLRFPERNSLNNITFLSEEKNKIWCVLPGKGIGYYDKSKEKFVDPGYISNDKQLLFYTFGEINVVDKKNFKILPTAAQHRFYTALQLNDDTLLVATARGIEMINRNSLKNELITPYKTDPLSVNRLHPVQMVKTKSNAVIISEGKELFELDMPNHRYSARLVNLQNEAFPGVGYITGLYSDSHENLWVLSENNGIYKINYHFAGFRYLGTADKKSNFVKTIYTDKAENRILCGTFGSGLHVFDTTQQLLYSNRVFPGVTDPATVCGFMRVAPYQYIVFLMGTWNVYLFNSRDYSLKKITIKKKLRDHPDYYLSLHKLNDSITLVQSGYNVFSLRWSQGLSVSLLDTFDVPAISSALDRQKNFWIGAAGKYFISKDGGHSFTSFSLPERILIRCFYENNDKEMWMGTEKGLYLLSKDGAVIRRFRSADGLPDENIYSIRKDKESNLWFAHNKGITCMKKDGSFLHFNKSDGLQENEFNTNTSCESPDGELFFGGVNGISSFYPSMVTGINEKPNVLLTKISVKEKSWTEDTAYWSMEKITLPYYDNTISFNLTAIGNRTPDQYNYQYQLLNQDASWVNAGSDPQVRYVLQPGRYVFRYYAGNSFNANPEDAKEIIIVIKPPFWKTAWFIISVIVLLAVLTILVTRYISQLKLKRRISELERKRMVDEERLRISREMHDDIGAGLTQITMMSEAAKTNTSDKESLENIATTSRKLVTSMSEIIWSMNPGNNRLEQLLSYLREQLNKLLEYSGIQHTISFPENDNGIQLNNSQRRNLLLIAKEIVHNAIKHSGAKNITITCKLDDKRLQFNITDDGKGFDTNKKTTGNGMRNIQRRIEELNGKLEVTSSSSGTITTFFTFLSSN